ncbi:hypothetical protein [Crenobacter cavernae]|uniref:Uncharacterized protein n=1 Tax=Crenobacter cavernae TaxID=2290923 RepID=A0A345Y7J3_9NEIS|nr:hypothetical protein [Crenobacter cavernae]AXK39895.1 hypothetical protein DWG20_10830 [Crenobacter cavernae]RXZ44265.1 hypothetical protein EBB06_06935 [Crenobacter cavernae]
MKCWTYDTQYGPFDIVPLDGSYHIMHEGEALGSYPTPEQAAEALANGHSAWPSFGNPHELGIPEDLSKWLCRPVV